ncbi:hypothetical protein DWU98_06495 [Dyella monticola]|uniref:Uncharacterized protein n=2 Tax=Dyella monticola TaxID=1927958 RepID=A0A370X371_9GAMM|nr:hypothetical protein DWU98_06495 [Dyella monticola]
MTYQPSSEVVYHNNVYRRPNGAGVSKGLPPDDPRSGWWYGGTLQNNYNIYAGFPPGTPQYAKPGKPFPGHNDPGVTEQPAAPIGPEKVGDSGPGPTRENTEALRALRKAFPDQFTQIGDYFRGFIGDPFIFGIKRKPDPTGIYIHGGKNADDNDYLSYQFKSFNKETDDAGKSDKCLQYFYLRPDDSTHLSNIDPENYKTRSEVITYNEVKKADGITHINVVNRYATFTVPRDSDWGVMERRNPDYAYLYVASSDPYFASNLPNSEGNNFLIDNSSNGHSVLARYQGAR